MLVMQYGQSAYRQGVFFVDSALSPFDASSPKKGSETLPAPELARGSSAKYLVAANYSCRLTSNRNRLKFEMPARQQRARPDELPRWVILCRKVARVNRIEFSKQR
jgi:hypothetical protein